MTGHCDHMRAEFERIAYDAAQDRFAQLEERVPGLALHSAGGACPFQMDGTLHGYPFYLRLRHSHVTLRVGTDDDSLFTEPLWMSGRSWGDPDDDVGDISDDDAAELFCELVNSLERAPRLWTFHGIAQTDLGPREPEGSAVELAAWGHTPQEAWERLVDPEAHRRVPAWQEYVDAHGCSPDRHDIDPRDWPDPEPVFTAA